MTKTKKQCLQYIEDKADVILDTSDKNRRHVRKRQR